MNGDHADVNPSLPFLDNFVIIVLLLISTYSFVYGNTNIRLLTLAFSLVCGLFRPFILVFSLSLASALEIVPGSLFIPMRILIVFASLAILIRIKQLMTQISRHDLVCMIFSLFFAIWCIACPFFRADIDEIWGVVLIFLYVTICFCLFIVIDKKYYIPTYLWLGLMPTVVASILAAFNLRVVGKFEYLITNEGLRYRGIVSDPNYLSSILLVGFATCIACLKIKNGVFLKLFYSAVSGAFFFAIWLTQSRAGIYTAFLIVTVFLLFQAVEAIKNFKKIPKLMIMFSMALALMMFLMSSQSRITTLAKREGITLIRIYSLEALSPLLQNPIFGPGEAVFLKKYGQVAHNTIISIGLEYGIIGMVFMAIAIAYCFFNLWKYRERGSFIYFLPFLALNIVLCSFSGIGHKLLWFYLVRASTFHERVLCNDETNLATCSQ